MTSFVTIHLTRSESCTPWGFRMYGGKDFSSSFVVQKINPGSLAERGDLRNGDEIVAIQDVAVENMLHKDGQKLVIDAGNALKITVKRQDSGYGSVSAPHRPAGHQPVSYPYNPPTPGAGLQQMQYQAPPSWQKPATATPYNPPQQQSTPYQAPQSSSYSSPQQSAASWEPPKRRNPQAKPQVVKKSDIRFLDSAGANQRAPQCNTCHQMIRGPFIAAMNKEFCKQHFSCSRPGCCNNLEEGFVEEEGNIYCISDYEQYFAPRCAKCSSPIVGECVHALQHTFHPHCFLCVQCRQPLGSKMFHVVDKDVYCGACWARDHQTLCYSCDFTIDPGDRWIEALGQNWHSDCFNCAVCQVNLADNAFFVKNNKPFCERHSNTKLVRA
ncbi:DgyrCDS2233 [Dimorphilus gyrociliatus]|uniref:DgyrCDS2233 n=1 Tax=Dimorphilus gyrociliatus TaxID=2664684 RepID=A0A7I8VER7_9ANNE|nr:DgyrCDS2233 [Dimorphilus gyrociliatus]